MCLLWVCPTNGIGQCVVFVFSLSHTARVIRASPRLSAVCDAIQNSAVWLGHVLCAPLPVDGHLDRFQPRGPLWALLLWTFIHKCLCGHAFQASRFGAYAWKRWVVGAFLFNLLKNTSRLLSQRVCAASTSCQSRAGVRLSPSPHRRGVPGPFSSRPFS